MQNRSIQTKVTKRSFPPPRPVGIFALDYLNELQLKFQLVLVYPEGDERGQVLARITIPRSGGTAQIEYKSNHPELESLAAKTLREVGPFPPLPPNSPNSFQVLADIFYGSIPSLHGESSGYTRPKAFVMLRELSEL